jgi:hypothetical protein
MKNASKRSGGFRDSADKPSKDVIDKVSRKFFPEVFCLIFTCYLLVTCAKYQSAVRCSIRMDNGRTVSKLKQVD